ncbi:major facilitator superfamily domain-containing protein 10 isoform X1 [Bos indicus x Bos taurus]|uniref:major facilitator superfamily domain-containing protein 10 isoform X2 n=3 Tax=Bos TaxID=9903 RepID=UPI000D53224B|nr:major facilitator superfamily domain-containing protein 10 isoform X2 [Bos taurus]XP_024848877.1 major facilitator superfamily domain-containing protein 10 isoform X2 [Bos taurus]XP_024848879.1 major facilitator superfamily domain-containing protein 10 isoform X2 [Bos taurus]XP_027401012.1 major facilitator superfamily domain-containing protein 10 isoform X1 [Bos indicus x Bos taurus]XP_027401013.1 major facilitator superfamily domain-containing protein 10 isoform X1 [Bos indicus x Bos tauru
MGCGAGGSCTPRPPIRQQQAPETRVVAVVFLGLLLDLLAFTLLLPLLPGLLESHGRAHDPLYGSWQRGVDWFAAAIGMPAEKRYNSVLFGGLIGSVFSLLQFLSAPLTGALSDCLGRRPGMLLSLAGVATSYAVWAASKSFAAFLASRVIGGISKGNVSLCTAIVADLGSPSARSKGMAVIGVAFSLGFTLGPTLGAFLPSETVPWLALLFAVSDLLFIWCFLPETLPPEKRAPSVTLGFRAAADLLSPLALLRFSAVARGPDPPTGVRLGSLRGLGLVYFLYLFLFSGLEFTLSFLVHQRFRFSRVEQGKMFFFIGLTMATIQGAYARRIRPGREIAAVKQAILLLIPASLFVGWGHTLPILGLGLLLYSWASPWCPPSRSRRGPLPVLRGRRLWLARAEGHGHGHAAELGRPGQGRGARGGRLSVLAGRCPCLLHRVRGALPAPLLHPADPEPPGADTQGRVAGPPACDDVRMGGCATFLSSVLSDTGPQPGLSMTKQLLQTKCLPAAHIPSPHLPQAPGAATGVTAVPAALTTGCQALPGGFPSALGWGWGGRLTPLPSPRALARSPQHCPLGKKRKTPGAGCFSDCVPHGTK